MADALNRNPAATPEQVTSQIREDASTEQTERNVDANPYTFRDHDPSTIDSGAPIPVAVDYVEAQLVELWRDIAEAAQAKGGAQAVTTAQVLNLVIRANSYKVANDYVGAIERITGMHPCRVIVAITDPAEDSMPVQAWVSIHCQLPPAGGRQVCCEQVSVAAGGESSRRIPAAVIPLLLPDLPVFLWWPQGEPFDEYVFRGLADSLNRLIVDSSTFENPDGTLSRMATQVHAQWPKIAVTDMNWGRLTPWREMVAGFFDAPTTRPYLDNISKVTIEYAMPEGTRAPVNRSQALLAAGWLASRLGWEPGEDVYQLVHSEAGHVPSAHLSMKAGKRPVTIDLDAVHWKATSPGDLYSITLQVGGNDPDHPQACFSVALTDKQESCAVMDVEIEGSQPTNRTINMDTLGQADLLDEELEVYSHDVVYEEALAMVGIFIRGTKHLTRSTTMSHRLPTGEPISAAQAARRPGPQTSGPTLPGQTAASIPSAPAPVLPPNPGESRDNTATADNTDNTGNAENAENEGNPGASGDAENTGGAA